MDAALIIVPETAMQEAAQRPPLLFYVFYATEERAATLSRCAPTRNAALSLRRLQAGRVGPIAEAQRRFGLTRFFEHGLLLGARRQERSLVARILREGDEAIL